MTVCIPRRRSAARDDGLYLQTTVHILRRWAVSSDDGLYPATTDRRLQNAVRIRRRRSVSRDDGLPLQTTDRIPRRRSISRDGELYPETTDRRLQNTVRIPGRRAVSRDDDPSSPDTACRPGDTDRRRRRMIRRPETTRTGTRWRLAATRFELAGGPPRLYPCVSSGFADAKNPLTLRDERYQRKTATTGTPITTRGSIPSAALTRSPVRLRNRRVTPRR